MIPAAPAAAGSGAPTRAALSWHRRRPARCRHPVAPPGRSRAASDSAPPWSATDGSWPRRWRLGLGLAVLRIDFRRLDVGQQLAGLHVFADVGVPALQIAAGARIDRCVDECLHIARQHQLVRELAARRGDHDHDRDRGLLGLLCTARLRACRRVKIPQAATTTAAISASSARRLRAPDALCTRVGVPGATGGSPPGSAAPWSFTSFTVDRRPTHPWLRSTALRRDQLP